MTATINGAEHAFDLTTMSITTPGNANGTRFAVFLVPEPSSLVLLGVMGVLVAIRRR